jgi:adenylate kinase family enzyme
MKRIMVVGTSCSGKTTLARAIAEAVGIPHVELDALHWGPDWSECPVDRFREVVRERVAGERWVVDGNYAKTRDIVLVRATDAIWLNYSLPVILARALHRTVRRVIFREELFGGNRETFRSAFLSRDSIPWWVLRTYRRRRREYQELFDSGEGVHVRLTELNRPGEIDELLRSFRAVACGPSRSEPGR